MGEKKVEWKRLSLRRKLNFKEPVVRTTTKNEQENVLHLTPAVQLSINYGFPEKNLHLTKGFELIFGEMELLARSYKSTK